MGGGTFQGEEKRKKRGRTHRVYHSVSKQKRRSDGRRQPMGCGRGSTEWEMVKAWGEAGGGAEVMVGGRERGRHWYFYPVTSR